MKFNYCYKCGANTGNHFINGMNRVYCKKCDFIFYENPIPSVAMIAFNEQNELLLTKRSVEPGKGGWCLPGGFIESGETCEQTVVREMKEETNLDCQIVDIIASESIINGFWGDIIVIAYYVKLLSFNLIAGDDASDAQFFPLDKKPEIVFPVHQNVLQKYLQSLIVKDHK